MGCAELIWCLTLLCFWLVKFLPWQKMKSQPWACGHRRGQAWPVALTVKVQEAELLLLCSRERGFEVNAYSLGPGADVELRWCRDLHVACSRHRVQAEFGPGAGSRWRQCKSHLLLPAACFAPGLTACLHITMNLKAPA